MTQFPASLSEVYPVGRWPWRICTKQVTCLSCPLVLQQIGLFGARDKSRIAQTGERRLGKKILDNVSNFIRSLESLKCILPWTLKFLSWNNQSNKIFPLNSRSGVWGIQNPKPVKILPPCVSGWEQGEQSLSNMLNTQRAPNHPSKVKG